MDLGDRMKAYEKIWDHRLPNRMPVLARVDGKGFSSWTRRMGFDKPFDPALVEAMTETTKALTGELSGVVLGYTQSDEISILLKNDQTFNTEPHRGNRVQKLVGDLVTIATAAFNDHLKPKYPAKFDGRVWVVPEAEVNNYFLWRQRDSYKNCVSAVAHYGLGDKYGRGNAAALLHGKDQAAREVLVKEELGLDMADYPNHLKLGTCVLREIFQLKDDGPVRSRWVADPKIPWFNEDPHYITARYLIKDEEDEENEENEVN